MTTTESMKLWQPVWPELEADGGVTWFYSDSLEYKLLETCSLACRMKHPSEGVWTEWMQEPEGIGQRLTLDRIREHVRERLEANSMEPRQRRRNVWQTFSHVTGMWIGDGGDSYDAALIAGFRWLRAQMPQDATEARTKKHDMTQKLI